jgi:hypothetical protein
VSKHDIIIARRVSNCCEVAFLRDGGGLDPRLDRELIARADGADDPGERLGRCQRGRRVDRQPARRPVCRANVAQAEFAYADAARSFARSPLPFKGTVFEFRPAPYRGVAGWPARKFWPTSAGLSARL